MYDTDSHRAQPLQIQQLKKKEKPKPNKPNKNKTPSSGQRLETEIVALHKELTSTLCLTFHLAVLLNKLTTRYNIPEEVLVTTSQEVQHQEILNRAQECGYTRHETAILKAYLEKETKQKIPLDEIPTHVKLRAFN